MIEQQYIIPQRKQEAPVNPEIRAAIDAVIAEAKIDTGEILIPPFGFILEVQRDLEARRAAMEANGEKSEWELSA